MTKQSLRRFWFQAHKWIGLLLAALIVPISFTGAVLVWHEELEPVVNPERHAVSGDTTIAPAAYLRAARAALRPGDRVASLSFPEGGGPVVVSAASAATAAGRSGPPPRTNVYLDPPTARVLDVAPGNAGVLRVLHVVHGSLMVPGVGRQVVGWIGVAMMVSALSGLWLWFPPMGRWTRGLRWRRQPSVNANLHHQFGFWVALPLFVLSLTGAWVSFPAFFGALVGEGERGGGRAQRMAEARARPLAATRMSLDEMLKQSVNLELGRLQRITWPTERTPDWVIRYSLNEAKVDDRTGTIRTKVDHAPRPVVARLMRRIHDGTGMPMAWRIVIFLGGLLPVALAVTGVIMWWRSRDWRAKARRPRVAVV